ncbi:F0F1 ATP synthase subunit A [Candidatus Saccharibacteria bacterium oral taxon 955]|nr:F0F1 ATP synthase subunit A [Candidatus Saccharibacteria bacterium oral taxon 955]
MITWFAATGPHISVKADEIFSVAGVSITNSHLLGILGLIVLVWALIATKRAAMGRTRHSFITKLFLWAFEGLYATVGQVIPDAKWARRVAPLSITIFFFVVAQYWMGLLPFVGPITVGEHHTPLFRGGVADLNMTFALAGVTIVAAQIYAFKYLGFRGNMGRYFISPLKNPIMSFIGILELIAEFSRLLGLSFRLFGNVLAGEVLLIMIAYLTQYISPVALQPFYIFELFIGGIQAYIFFMLSTVFISLGLQHHGDDEEKSTHSGSHSSSRKIQTAVHE